MSRSRNRQANEGWRPAPPRESLEGSILAPGQIREAFSAAFPTSVNLTEVSSGDAKGGSKGSDSKSGGDKSVKAGSATYDISTLSKVKSDGSPADQAKVRSAAEKAYPELKSGGDSKSGGSKGGNPFAKGGDSKPSKD